MVYFIGFNKRGEKYHLSLVGPCSLFSILFGYLARVLGKKPIATHLFITHQRGFLDAQWWEQQRVRCEPIA